MKFKLVVLFISRQREREKKKLIVKIQMRYNTLRRFIRKKKQNYERLKENKRIE